MKLSIVIPIYNESATLCQLVDKVCDAAVKIASKIDTFEIVMVDDCSDDGSRALLQEHFSNRPNFKVLFQKFNQGKGAALCAGIAKTDGDIVLIQDADLEYDPSDYPVLLGPILSKRADVVYGSRFKGDISRVLYYYHYLGNQFLTLMSNIFTNLNLSDMETCYKVFRGPIIRQMIITSKRFGVEPEMTAKIAKIKGIRIYEVPISYFGRTYDEGKKIGWKDGVSAIWSILKYNVFTSLENSFSTIPKIEDVSK
ncbi:MAG: glycosyl transferase [Bdellovibrionales bacterium GWA2_49_15]|nr:MAG: glycosyl transferase [Bdellovibrionales bacterium GWA2_49_15]HAZ11651.1 glycosyl transferase [Bdellovibrionales bacterium]